MNMEKTIVYLPSVDFNFLTQAPQQMLMVAARNGWKVTYCNANTRKDKYMEEIIPNLTVCHDTHRFMNECKQNNTVFDVRLVSVPQYVTQCPYPKGTLNIFYLYDHFDHWKVAEKQAFENSDIVLTTADYLYDLRKDEYNHPNFYTVKNGVPEYYLTTEIKEPEEFKNLPRPIIGFIGAIGNWVDTSLMKKIADKYTTVFIGTELEKPAPKNMINLGYIDNSRLVDYYGSLDVGLIPFRTTGMYAEITRASCPIKLFEYMGVGTPCVANKWSETDIYPDIVFDSVTDDEFMKNIEVALSLSKEEYVSKCRSEARNHTWESRWKQIEDIMVDYKLNKNVDRVDLIKVKNNTKYSGVYNVNGKLFKLSPNETINITKEELVFLKKSYIKSFNRGDLLILKK